MMTTLRSASTLSLPLHSQWQACEHAALRILILGLLLLPLLALAQLNTVNYTSNGTFVVPAGVAQITVECWGGGGAGGRATSNGGNIAAGGGGGGGAYVSSVLNVSPSQSYTITVANAKASSTTNGPAANDGNSSIVLIAGNPVVRASGGPGGTGYSTNGSPGGGAGGAWPGGVCATCLGDVIRRGGNGFAGVAGTRSGSGGGGAGSTAQGADATGSAGGGATTQNGGSGATGANTANTNGGSGSIYGGGGAGGYRTSGGSTYTGGTGAAGFIRVTYTCAIPTITPGGPTSFCPGGSVTLTSSGGPSYLWSTGATTQSINVNSTGDYTVTVTDGLGCTETSSATSVTVLSSPTALITPNGPTSFCAGGDVTFTASGGVSYLWNTGATTADLIANTTGTNSVTVTGANSCTATASQGVTVNPVPTPTITPAGTVNLCTGSSLNLTSSAASSYLWSTAETTATISVSSGGAYSVTVTDANGCTGTSTATTVNEFTPPVADITPGGPTTFCAGGSVTLTASGGGSYLWSPGGATTSAISASVTGTFTVTVTGSGGCTATASQGVSVDPAPSAAISPSGPTNFCAGGNVTLTASGGTDYSWSTGSTDAAINVNSTGTYTVTVTGANGCTATVHQIVTVNPLPSASITPDGPTTFCAGGNVTLTASGGTDYSWSTGATNAAISVNTTGTYTVTVFGTGGCTATASQGVTVNPLPTPTITPSGPTSFCTGGSVNLTANAGSSYLWNPGGATNQMITVSTNGSYTVIVTDANSCSVTSAPTVVTVNLFPAGVTASASANPICSNDNIIDLIGTAPTIQVTSPTGGSINIPSGGSQGVGGPYPAQITVSGLPASGVWVRSVQINGLTHGNLRDVDLVLRSPGGQNVVLLSDAGSGGNLASVDLVFRDGAPGPLSNVTNPMSGQYRPTNYDTNTDNWPAPGPGIFAQANPVLSLFSGNMNGAWQLFAVDDNSSNTGSMGSWSITFQHPSNGSTLVWSSVPPGFSSNILSPIDVTVPVTTTYTLAITSAAGCTSSASTVVTVNTAPTATITPGGPTTFCEGGSVILTASGASGFLWSTGATSAAITVSTSGTYTVTVSDGSGCTGTASQLVTVNPLPSASINVGGPTTFCAGGSVTLTASAGSSWLWSTGASTQTNSVNTTGSYTVTVTNANGCSATSAATNVTVNPIPIAAITPNGPTTFCAGGSVTLTASGGTSYVWSPGGATTAAITRSTSGTYTVTVSGTGGCTATASQVVTVHPVPTATITPGGPTTFCDGGSVTLTASTGTSWLWSTGATNQAISATTSDGYTVTVTNANGCSATSVATNVTVETPTTWYADFDGDGLGDPNNTISDCAQPNNHIAVAGDDCPLVIGTIGSPCNDGNPFTINDELDANCNCVGTPTNCSNVFLQFTTDANAPTQTSWQILDPGTNNVICQNSGPLPGNATDFPQLCCLPEGCFDLRVSDSGGDGLLGGGYRLIDSNGKRIIDNSNAGAFGPNSGVSGLTPAFEGGAPYSFCLPVGNDRLIVVSCDKTWWRANEFVVANENTAVSAIWSGFPLNSVQRAQSGYEFWYYDPNGTFSFRRFRSHATTDGAGTGALRACHMRIQAAQIPEFVKLNVKVRGRTFDGTNTVLFPWGAACRFVRNEAAALCPPTKLMDLPGNAFLSCGQTRVWGTNSYIHSRAVSGATAYQWRFRLQQNPENLADVYRTSSSYFLQLGWANTLANPALIQGAVYEVEVRARINGVWCADLNQEFTTLNPPPTYVQWGDVCTLGILFQPVQGGGVNMAMEEENSVVLQLWPNPTRGDMVQLAMTGLAVELTSVNVEILSMTGQRMRNLVLPVDNGALNATLEFGSMSSNGELAAGMYLLTIMAGDKVYTQRLMVQP